MLDAKNTYLIGITMSNKAKDKFYEESVPAIEDVSPALINVVAFILSPFVSNTVRFRILQEFATLESFA
jgi:hypothetical protein